MIREIRRKFIRIAVLVLSLAMVTVTLVINLVNWVNVRSELRETLEYLSVNTRMDSGRGKIQERPGRGGFSRHMRNTFNESRFFSATVLSGGRILLGDVSMVEEEDEDTLRDLVEKASSSGREEGLLGDYMFRENSQREGIWQGVFLNCETRLTNVRRLAVISVLVCLGCIALSGLLVAYFSRLAIRPLIENAVQQKQFITDAGHELKTPLTVISANMDVLSQDLGDNPWVRSTRKQVASMRQLVSELIYLSRMDEEDAHLQMERLDLSTLVRQEAEPFEGMAEFSGKRMLMEIKEGVFIQGDRAACRRMVSVLCDNAVKYAPTGDEIHLGLGREGRSVRLTVENGVENPLEEETLRHLFDRFYRADPSRSRKNGGYGIGLSVARSIAHRHGVEIRVWQGDGRISFAVTFPVTAFRGTGKGQESKAEEKMDIREC